MTTPFVIFTDHLALPTGLARIGRDIAVQMDAYLNDKFRICALGSNHPGSIELPFPTYHWSSNDWFIPHELPFIWENFCRGDSGILFTIQDIQRMLQIADSKLCVDQAFGKWMNNARVSGMLKLWGYFPIDAHGLNGKLPPQLAHTLTHYDRILVPSKWAAEIIHNTLPDLKVDILPHGIDTDVFKPTPKPEARAKWAQLHLPNRAWPQAGARQFIPPEALRIGIVATNQARKDWGLGLEVIAELKKSRPVHLWAHTDYLRRDNGWSILELLSELALLGCSTVTTGTMTDQTMAMGYSALDLTLGIGRGEGFGYPIYESIYCGTPCFTHRYGAQNSFLPWFLPAETLRLEGHLNLLRPLSFASEWVPAIQNWMEEPESFPKQELKESLAWVDLWPRFSEWLLEGLK